MKNIAIPDKLSFVKTRGMNNDFFKVLSTPRFKQFDPENIKKKKWNLPKLVTSSNNSLSPRSNLNDKSWAVNIN